MAYCPPGGAYATPITAGRARVHGTYPVVLRRKPIKVTLEGYQLVLFANAILDWYDIAPMKPSVADRLLRSFLQHINEE